MAPEWGDRKKKVASTDLLGDIVELMGQGITQTREGNRDEAQMKELRRLLQLYKENKLSPPAPTTSCCGYPHYDNPKRPNFGPSQIRYLCQLQQGMRVRKHYSSTLLDEIWAVLSAPYQIEGKNSDDWCVNIRTKNVNETHTFTADANVTPYKNGLWNHSNWLSFVNPPACRPHHFCCNH